MEPVVFALRMLKLESFFILKWAKVRARIKDISQVDTPKLAGRWFNDSTILSGCSSVIKCSLILI
jgi:hypothetical protein